MAGTHNFSNVDKCITFYRYAVKMVCVSIIGFSSMPDRVVASENIYNFLLVTEIQDDRYPIPVKHEMCITFEGNVVER